jgi:formylmethanofuran dehydrogenase subunit E
VIKPFDDLKLAQAFHGHLGANLVIGIKMGNFAVEALRPECCFRLRAEVYCPARPPVSCLIDGIQLSTGCTMGKKNIIHIVSDDPVKAVFTNTVTGESVSLQLVEGFIEETVRWTDEAGEQEASERTWNTADNKIFRTCE